MNYTIKENRLDSWNSRKKEVHHRNNINFYEDKSVKFTIKPWSVWWFDIGENVGSETSCHYTNNTLSTLRPCIVVSTKNFHHATYNKKVMIMPLTSKKENTKVRHFHYELKADNYQAYHDKRRNIHYKGLEKDSLVICNDIKTIDTKRLLEYIYPQLNESDTVEIKKFIGKYLGV